VNPGGITETIWYFAGYLQLANEVARADELFEGSARIQAVLERDVATESPDLRHPENLDAAPAAAVRSLADPTSLVADVKSLNAFLHELSEFVHKAAQTLKFPLAEAPKQVITIPGGSITENISITYSDAGDQMFANVNQVNLMNDDDLLGDPNSGITELHEIDVAETIHALIELAQAEAPDDFPISAIESPAAGSAVLVDAVEARDTARTAGQPSETGVVPGHYVNGAMVPEAPASDDSIPEPVEPVAPSGFGHINSGLEAEMGGNVALNAAVIIDLNELSTSMIVVGDYFESHAIVQTNVYRDHDQIEVAGESAARHVTTGENTADNIASIVSNQFEIDGWGHSGEWHVDVVEGDFFDIKSLKQINWMSDNDTAVQMTSTSYYTVTAGASAQYNVANLYHTASYYDLIIVGGDYHEVNWIFQTNILLDDDIVNVVSERDDTISQTISTGGNELTNEATIEKFGGNEFQSLPADMSGVVDGIATNNVSVAMAWQLYATANTLNILFVEGDYYDVNVVSQTNVIADVDTVAQFLPEFGGVAPESEHGNNSHSTHESETTSEQHVSTGGNKIKNIATIVDTGPASDIQYVGGDHYEEVVLVQTNIIENEEQKVVYGDTSKLASEVIAFTGDDYWEEDPECSTPVRDPGCYDDLMGNLVT
jgi:hypothetical protein